MKRTLCEISTECVTMTSSLEHQPPPQVSGLVFTVLFLSFTALTLLLIKRGK